MTEHGASLFESLFTAIDAGVWVLDPQYRTEYVNPCMARMLGCTPTDMGRASLLDFIPEAARSAALAHLEQGRLGSAEPVDLPLQPRQASPRWVMVSTKPLQAARPGHAGLVCHVVDITERRLAEEALRRTAAHHHVLTETAEDHIFVIDREDRVEFVNQAAARQLGTAPEQLIGRSRTEIFPPDVAERQGHGLQQVFDTGKSLYAEGRTVYRDREVWLGTWLAPVHDATGLVTSVLGVSRDMTEHRRLEAELSNAQKLEAIGRLAGGVAHDFNNHLTVILGCVELMLERNGTAPIAEDLLEVQSAGMRAAGLVQRLLAFGRRQVLQPRRLDLNTLIGGLQSMLERLIGSVVQIDVTLAEDLPSVIGDAGELEQVVMNLVLNGRDAMPTGGTLSIETSLVTADRTGPPTLTPGAHVLMTIRDTGVGMNADVKTHVFEPFFTTKSEGQGTGLGLSTVYGIVKRLDGRISVESEIGQGSAFHVYLPVARDEADPEPNPSVSPMQPPVDRRETILVVDDEDTVRRVVTLALKRHGFSVIDVSTPEEALSLAATVGQSLSLLLTDIAMPRIDGRVLAERVTQIRPEIPVLYMSGYPAAQMLQTGLIDSCMRLIYKPFTTAELLTSVRDAMGTP
ncbi:MAG: PAS domain S-box protein [Acidobacteria bacterium]|nr:PAS domain S-box protein [Acidobacteriota bacterium]